MNTTDDRFWDDLGIAWRAVEIDSASLVPRLRARLRREVLLQRASSAVMTTCAIILVAAAVLWIKITHIIGWWIAALLAVFFAAATPLVRWVERTPISGDTESLTGMIDLSISRAKRQQRESRIAYPMCLILLLTNSLILYIASTRYRHPVAWAWLLIATVVAAITLAAYGYRLGRSSHEREARFSHLRPFKASSVEFGRR